eukprot:12032555-Ditylum_brightwellii.AAC.1
MQELESIYNIAPLIDDLKRKTIVYEYGSLYVTQNLQWMQNLITNSCNGDLQNCLKNKLLTILILSQGGPVVFKIMIKIIFSVTDQALQAIVDRIESITVTECIGEDVSVMT